jgi:hypothetical protein
VPRGNAVQRETSASSAVEKWVSALHRSFTYAFYADILVLRGYLIEL